MAERQTPEIVGLPVCEGVSLDKLILEDAIEGKLNTSGSCNFLIVGKHQVGKSALINCFFYEDGNEYVQHATEGCLKPETKEVTLHELEYHGVTFNIYDTRGLQDGQGLDIDYLREIYQKCGTIHLFIFCTKLDDPIRPEEVKALKGLTLTFGESLWQNSIIALTFSNQVKPPHPGEDKIEFFNARVKIKSSLLREFLIKDEVNVNPEIVRSITILPTGCSRKWKLPGIKNWRNKFWIECVTACKEEAQGALLKYTSKSPSFFELLKENVYSVTVVGGVAATAIATRSPVATGVVLASGGVVLAGGALYDLIQNAGGMSGLIAILRRRRKED